MLKKVLIIAFALTLTACKVAPIKNITSDYIPTKINGDHLTQVEVRRAIMAAAQKKGWNVKVLKPGLIRATLRIRVHNATINIPYTKNSYRLEYKSSENLKYNNGNIHNNYNRWVAGLANEIENQLEIRAYYNKDLSSE